MTTNLTNNLKTDPARLSTEDFEQRLQALRPRLHRYCARMTGSAIDGEDVLQEALTRAYQAQVQGTDIERPDSWLFRIAHNASMDFLRQRGRQQVVPLTEDLEAAPLPDTDLAAFSFHTSLQLPELQRCAVILKDVLGYSVEEVAAVADCSHAAAKSALQRGRAALRVLASTPADARVPLVREAERMQLARYVQLFQLGDFDAIRDLLAEEVQLDLVNRLKLSGRDQIARYFSRYAEATRWRYALGAVEGQLAMLVFDADASEKPAHFVLLDWRAGRLAAIRDFLFAPYALDGADWLRLP